MSLLQCMYTLNKLNLRQLKKKQVIIWLVWEHGQKIKFNLVHFTARADRVNVRKKYYSV